MVSALLELEEDAVPLRLLILGTGQHMLLQQKKHNNSK
jgi:hypothetical protein